MARPIPTIEHAEGMLAAIRATHTCTEACTGTVTLGDGKVVTLTCPWERIGLDLDNEQSRRIVGGVYASEALAAMGSVR
jgi:hypothetical protein